MNGEIIDSTKENHLNPFEIEVFTCRICLQEEISTDSLISPCLCSGTAKYVHEDCLNRWREMSVNPNAATGCLICSVQYNIISHPTHYFHGWCLSIEFNGNLIYILHQFFTCILTLLLFATTYKQRFTKHSSSNDEIINPVSIDYPSIVFQYYCFSLFCSTMPIILYTTYTICRYAQRKKILLRKVLKRSLKIYPYMIFGTMLYVSVPEFGFIVIQMGLLLFNHLICLIMKYIEKTNRLYGRPILLSLDRIQIV